MAGQGATPAPGRGHRTARSVRGRACRGGAFLGVVTNNVAEYQALLWGLRAAIALGARRVLVLADSELVVKQLRGSTASRTRGSSRSFLKRSRCGGS